MKRIASIVTLLLLAFAVAQQSDSLYMPDGTRLDWPAAGTLASVLEEHFPNTPYSTHAVPTEGSAVISVYFQLFTDNPLFLYIHLPAMTRPIEVSDIDFFLSTFDLERYLRDWRFPFDLEFKAIPSGLPDTYFLQSIGHPDDRASRVTASGRYEIWRYYRYGVSLEFLDGRLVAFTEP